MPGSAWAHGYEPCPTGDDVGRAGTHHTLGEVGPGPEESGGSRRFAGGDGARVQAQAIVEVTLRADPLTALGTPADDHFA